ncbi:Wzz/FepE/Etk N-terminal domain-containing protein [Paenibacillus sp. SC116]|uniref:YveK family protein n=1 Tax=Paenibacillus sp. SC116 TaxID=2968986 RepID=UPI00215A83A5|nr:Wzz/FepE/Etk N-terminal domain-containing protein [Paenibacillus sp. SC116]MCR8844178.1 Wzz/FepE/Etk N-terminal domain-containing protein [Paenibacillus sp. SC116]
MELDLKHMLQTIWKRKGIIAFFVVIGIIASSYYSYLVLKPVYQASTKFIVNKTQFEEGQGTININELNANIKLIQTYKELIRTDWILKEVLRKNADIPYTTTQLLSMVKVSSTNDTQVVTISVENESYQMAARIANEVTLLFIAKIPSLMHVDNVTLLTSADKNADASPIKPNRLMNVIIAAIAAFVAGISLALVISFFDDSVYTEEDIELATGLTTLAVIPKMNRKHVRSKHDRASKQRSTTSGGDAYVTTQ